MSTFDLFKSRGRDIKGHYVAISLWDKDPLFHLSDIALMWIDGEGVQLPFIAVPSHYKTIDLTPVKRLRIIGVDII